MQVRTFVMAAAVLVAEMGAQAQDRPIVVELFTSQGCSSCPPAEAVLLDLAERRDDVLALAFHVDYWDRLGWPDPYASPAATWRQRAYAVRFGANQVYTPQMVSGSGTLLGSGSLRDRGLRLAL